MLSGMAGSSPAMTRMPLSPPTATLLRQFHARKPARIWSLIVTLYGDAIVPRGGSLWVGSLIEIMALFDIDAGHVRTAVSRLAADGWLASTKRGRASYYRLSRGGEAEFLQATQRIYAGVPVRQGEMLLALIGSAATDPAKSRAQLDAAGFAAVSPAIHAGFGDLPETLSGCNGVYAATPHARDRCAQAQVAFRLHEVSQAYRDFVGQFAPLADALEKRAPDEAEALLLRTLLIHAFRRVVLRDPGLPADLLPEDWQGGLARKLTARIYRQVAVPSEAFLNRVAQNEQGTLPAPGPDFAARFENI